MMEGEDGNVSDSKHDQLSLSVSVNQQNKRRSKEPLHASM